MPISMFNLPLWSTVDNARVGSIIGQQTGFANAALSAMGSYVQQMVDYATQAIDVPLPAAMAAGLDFDFSMQAFLDILGRKPVEPVITDDGITVVLPVPPVIDVPNIQGIILSNLWNDIYKKLNDDITSGGYGIDTADEILIWERAKERELFELAGQYEETDELYAGAGYKFPPGALVKTKQKAKQGYQAKLATLNRDMTIERLKLFVEARKFALEKGVDFGKLFIEIGGLRIAQYESDIKGALGKAELERSNQLLKLEAYKASIEGYAAEVRAIASLYDLASTMQEREVRVQVAVLQANIEIAKAALEQAIEQAKLRLAGTQTAADVYKAICASALGTIHASASLSSGFSVQYGYGKNESKNESYQLSAQEG